MGYEEEEGKERKKVATECCKKRDGRRGRGREGERKKREEKRGWEVKGEGGRGR